MLGFVYNLAVGSLLVDCEMLLAIAAAVARLSWEVSKFSDIRVSNPVKSQLATDSLDWISVEIDFDDFIVPYINIKANPTTFSVLFHHHVLHKEQRLQKEYNKKQTQCYLVDT